MLAAAARSANCSLRTFEGPHPNLPEAFKRPRSSMSPTLVFHRRSGELLMSLGSPGGPAIIHFTAKTLLGSLPWGLNAQQAIDLPNFGSFNGPTVLEAGRFSPAVVQAIRKETSARHALLLKHLDGLPSGHVLDFGCGAGVLGATVKRRYPQSRVTLLDVDARVWAEEAALIPELIAGLKEAGRGDIKVTAGGVIPPQDYDFLREAGVQGIYGPGSNVVECAADILVLLGHNMPPLGEGLDEAAE